MGECVKFDTTASFRSCFGAVTAVGGDKFFKFVQMTPADTWNITHNLNKFPSVTVVDSAGSVVVGDVQYIDQQNITIMFQAAFSGTAYLN